MKLLLLTEKKNNKIRNQKQNIKERDCKSKWKRDWGQGIKV